MKSGTYNLNVLLVSVVLLISGNSAVAAALSFSGAPTNVVISDVFPLDVYVDTQNASTNTVDVRITYDPLVVNMVAVNTANSSYSHEFGLPQDVYPLRTINNAAGEAQVIMAVPTGANGGAAVNGTNLYVMQVVFKAVGAGNANIQLDYTGVGDPFDSNVVQDLPTPGLDMLSSVNNAGMDSLIVTSPP